MSIRSNPIAMGNLSRYRAIVDDWTGFIETLSSPLPKSGWINLLKTNKNQFLAEGWLDSSEYSPLDWHEFGMRFSDDFVPGKSLAYSLGLLHIQEEASMLPVKLLGAVPGERVLDLCSAPGNKTSGIAVQMGNTGTLVANDVDPMRLKSLKIAASRLGLLNLVTTVRDGRDFQSGADSFDRVLVDAPCSCEGTIRKNPNVLNHKLASDVPFASGLQLGLLKKAVEVVKPGGIVVYSTCTFRPEENEMVVDNICRRFPVSICSIEIPGFRLDDGLTSWGENHFLPELALTRRVWPHHNNTGGFYLALLKKDK